MASGCDRLRLQRGEPTIDAVETSGLGSEVISTAASNPPLESDSGSILPYEGGAARQVARNSVIQSLGKLFSYASGLLIVALTARLLSKTDYGNYTIAVVYLSFVFVLSDLGIGLIAVREASRAPERLGTLYNTALTLKAISALVVYSAAIALIVVLPYDQEVKVATCVLAASMVLTSISASFDIPFQSKLQMQTPTLAEMSVKIVTFVGTAAFFVLDRAHPLGEGVLFYGIVGVVAAANVASFLIRWHGGRRLLPGRIAPRLQGWAPMLRMALPMGIVTILGQIHYKADTIILSLLRPPSDVAVYGVAYKLLDFMLVFFGVFVSTVYPVLARYSAQDRQRVNAAVVRVLNMCISVAVPATAGVIVLAPEIVDVIGGGRYPQAALPLQILALAMIFTTLATVYNYLVIVQDRQRSLIWVSCIGIAANVGLNLWAIPRYSYLGSAVATDVTEGLGMVVVILIASRINRAAPSMAIVLRVVAACALMCVVITGLRIAVDQFVPVPLHSPSTLALIGVGIGVYSATLYLLGGADEALVRMVARRVPGLARLPVRHVTTN